MHYVLTKYKYILGAILLTLALIFSMIFSIQPVTTALADINTVTAFESRNVMDDLSGSTIGGFEFNIENFPYKEEGKPQVITLVEFAYSQYPDKQDDFGLYVYVYNPQDKAIDTSTTRNVINLGYGDCSRYDNYSLYFLNYSTQVGYEGRFYKFRVTMSRTQIQNVLTNVNSNGRVYSVVSIQLSYGGVLRDYVQAQTYTYTGYSKGYGSELATGDTLSCSVDGFDTYIDLDVHHSIYRANGDYWNGEQSQLNSVYFRVPNRFFNDYGDLSAIDCEWWEYLTKPMLVVENNARYVANMINSLYGRPVSKLDSDKYGYYLFMCFSENIKKNLFEISGNGLGFTNYSGFIGQLYKYGFAWRNEVDFTNFSEYDYANRTIAAAFTANDLKDFYISGDVVKKRLLENSEQLGGDKVGSGYSEALFEEFVEDGYDRGHNRRTITPDTEQTVFWNTTTKDLWAKIWTGKESVTTSYDYLKSIITIDPDKDLVGTNSEIANELYINENDVDDFKLESAKAKALDETLVLLRFSTTKYFCANGVYSSCSKGSIEDGKPLAKSTNDKIPNWNCSFVQESIYLDFDIISLTFTYDGVDTVIPVVSSPIDIIGGLTPSLEDPWLASNGKGLSLEDIIKIFIAVVLVILLVFILVQTGLLSTVIKGIVWLITLPFRAIASLIKQLKRKKE